MNKVILIALTGGPCAGKSTGLSKIVQDLTSFGKIVLTIEETATQVINSGANPNLGGIKAFEKLIMKIQHAKEIAFKEYAVSVIKDTEQDVVIIFDRGLPDCKVYMDDSMYDEILNELGLTDISTLDFYDGAMHLVTAAKGAKEFYTTENNKARRESVDEAVEIDDKTLKVWNGHNHLRVIDNENVYFTQKINNLIKEVHSLLGIPVPLEIERKFLIKKPDFEKLKSLYECTTVSIVQTYLISEDNTERRVRQRGINGNYTFYYTEKKRINDLTREEKEEKITRDEYINYLTQADTNLHQIIKERTCFISNNLYFELDDYPFWDDKAILEIELTEENKEITLPNGIEIIKEVTSDNNYSNYSLAKTQGVI